MQLCQLLLQGIILSCDSLRASLLLLREPAPGGSPAATRFLRYNFEVKRVGRALVCRAEQPAVPNSGSPCCLLLCFLLQGLPASCCRHCLPLCLQLQLLSRQLCLSLSKLPQAPLVLNLQCRVT